LAVTRRAKHKRLLIREEKRRKRRIELAEEKAIRDERNRCEAAPASPRSLSLPSAGIEPLLEPRLLTGSRGRSGSGRRLRRRRFCTGRWAT
jgi:hypothetical protein